MGFMFGVILICASRCFDMVKAMSKGTEYGVGGPGNKMPDKIRLLLLK